VNFVGRKRVKLIGALAVRAEFDISASMEAQSKQLAMRTFAD
jgi:hypothetical protein